MKDNTILHWFDTKVNRYLIIDLSYFFIVVLWPLCSFSSIKFFLPSAGVFSVFKCSRLHWKIFNVSVFATYKIHDTKLYILFWLRGFGYSRRNVRSFFPHGNNLLFVIVACTCHSLWKENKMTGNTMFFNSSLLSIWDVKQ
jgi:hypothetical protein